MARLGLEALIGFLVLTRSALAGRLVLTVVSAMLAGATHITNHSHPTSDNLPDQRTPN